MTDPFDSLRRDRGFTAPDPRFRADLLARIEHALVTDEPTIDPLFPTTFEPMEITMPTDNRPSRTRLALIVGGVAAAVVLLVTLLALRDGDSTEPASDSTELAAPSTSTSPPSTAAPTTTVKPITDAEVAEAGFLTTAEIGGGYAPLPSATVLDLRTPGGPGAEDPACEPFLPTVFESDARPATVRIKGYQAQGAAQQMYVVVFPEQAGAEAMMAAVADPAFPACMAAVISESYAQSDPAVVTNRTPLVPELARPLTSVGDEMTVLAFKGSYDLGGSTWSDEGLIPFVRVGRAVFWMNPNSARTAANTDGYSDEQLQAALAVASQHLRAAQSG